jgi:polysaccharide export outer membrane protein
MYRPSILVLASAIVLSAQEPPKPVPPSGERAVTSRTSGRDVLKVNDQLLISAKDVPGMVDRPYRIDSDGTVTLPLVGKVRAEGLTLPEFEKELITQFGVYLRTPQISVKQMESTPDIAANNTFVVAGSFKSPGVYPLADRRGVLDVISAAGGLQPNSSRSIRITRRIAGSRNPLPGGAQDPQAGTTVASVNLTRLIENPALREDVLIEPGDVLYAEPAVVYLTGQVAKPGSFDLIDRESLGVTELIALGGGLTRDAAPQKAAVLRPILGGARRAEIPVDAKSILAGRQTDFRILPGDIVLIPPGKSVARAVGKIALIAIPALVATGIYAATR